MVPTLIALGFIFGWRWITIPIVTALWVLIVGAGGSTEDVFIGIAIAAGNTTAGVVAFQVVWWLGARHLWKRAAEEFRSLREEWRGRVR